MTMQLSSIGSYRIIRLLGEGTFGVVYEAYQPFLDRKVAIKTLHADLTATAQIEQQFMQEARTIARLRHHHIVAIHEFGTIPTEPNPLTYMVMEYLSGETLLERIRRSAIELPLLVVVIEKIAEGLDYAHAHQVIHRDLKPANVIFSEGNEPVIVDFGLAKLMALTSIGDAAKLDTVSNEKESTISGTPAYMSPEQAAGEAVSYATDQYALATMTYEMLSGQLPYNANNPMTLVLKRIVEQPTPLRQYVPQFTAEVEAVLQRALARNPADRYPSAGEFARELGDALLPDRRRTRVITVTDPLQAAQLRAARQALAGFLWGMAGVVLIVLMFSWALFLRGYSIGSPAIFVWDGLFFPSGRLATGQRVVSGVWPGSPAARAGYQVGDLIQDDILKMQRFARRLLPSMICRVQPCVSIGLPNWATLSSARFNAATTHAI